MVLRASCSAPRFAARLTANRRYDYFRKTPVLRLRKRRNFSFIKNHANLEETSKHRKTLFSGHFQGFPNVLLGQN